jgi:hypothetical protein
MTLSQIYNQDTGFVAREKINTSFEVVDVLWSLTAGSENSANKDTDNTLSSYSNIKYPSQRAVKDYVDNSQLNIKKGSFGVGFYKGTNTIASGEVASLVLPMDGVITGWQIFETSDTPILSNISIGVWKDSYINYPPNISDSITGTEKPGLSASTKNQDLSLTSWTATFSAGDILKFKVESASLAKNVLLNIFYTKL